MQEQMYKFIKIPFLRRPWVTLSITLAFHSALEAITFSVESFIRYPSDDIFRMLSWDYPGLVETLKFIFVNRNELFSDFYIPSSVYYYSVFLIFLWTVLSFSVEISQALTPGPVRRWWLRITNFLNTPNTLIFLALIILNLQFSNTFLKQVKGIYMTGINKSLQQLMNDYSGKRLKNIRLEKKEIACTFSVTEKIPAVSITYLDFLYHLIFHEYKEHQKIEATVKSLPLKMEVFFDNSEKGTALLPEDQEAFSRSEVEAIIIALRKSPLLPQAPNYPKSQAYLKIKRDGRQSLLLLVRPSEPDILLGSVKYKCDNNIRNLQVFMNLEMLNGFNPFPIFED